MNHYIILALLIVALALSSVGCDDGRDQASRRPGRGSPANAVKPEPSGPPSGPAATEPAPQPAQAARQAEEAQSTAADLGQAITTLGEVCETAQETRRALLTRDYNAGKAVDQPAKEVEHHGDK